MATPNREELYRMALNAAKNKQIKPAKVMLQQLLSQDEKHIRAMMLMSKISNKKDRRMWLNKILEVDPDYDDALDQLEKMEYQDKAKRNITMMRYGLGAGAVGTIAVALLMIVSAASAPI